jgi:hypothetical protein
MIAVCSPTVLDSVMVSCMSRTSLLNWWPDLVALPRFFAVSGVRREVSARGRRGNPSAGQFSWERSDCSTKSVRSLGRSAAERWVEAAATGDECSPGARTGVKKRLCSFECGAKRSSVRGTPAGWPAPPSGGMHHGSSTPADGPPRSGGTRRVIVRERRRPTTLGVAVARICCGCVSSVRVGSVGFPDRTGGSGNYRCCRSGIEALV